MCRQPSPIVAKKVVTAFTDGDRGGELIIKELLQVADIDFVARAPEGKSVEDMTQKEIVQALRQKIPVEQVLDQYKIKNQPKKRREITTKRKSLIREKPFCVRNTTERAEAIAPRRVVPREVVPKSVPVPVPVIEQVVVAAPEPVPEPEPQREWFRQHVDELDGTLSARIMDRNQNVLKQVAVRDLGQRAEGNKWGRERRDLRWRRNAAHLRHSSG